MQIETRHIIECPQHGLFYSPDYWPCPHCFEKPRIQKGPACWVDSWIMWKGQERAICLSHVNTDDPEFREYKIIFRRHVPAI